MAEVVTIVDGVTYLLGDIAKVGELQWSTGWPYGCLEASWTMALKRNTFPKALTPNAWVEIWDGPIRVWSGYISEPVPGDVWTIHALGWYAALGNLLALDSSGMTTVPTSIPQTALEQEIARAGLPVTIGTTLSSSAFSSGDETVQVNAGLAFLDAVATAEGKRWAIDADYVFTMAADPTTSRYALESTQALRGTADDDYVTDVYVRYVTAVDVDDNPTAWGLEHVTAASSPAGRRERVMDVTDLGIMSSGTAAGYGQGQLDLNSGRLGYTNGLEITYGELVRPGGSPARLGLVKAGESFTAFTVADASGAVQLGLTQDVVIGRTTYSDGAKTLAVDPVGLAPRTFVDSLRALKQGETFNGTAA